MRRFLSFGEIGTFWNTSLALALAPPNKAFTLTALYREAQACLALGFFVLIPSEQHHLCVNMRCDSRTDVRRCAEQLFWSIDQAGCFGDVLTRVLALGTTYIKKPPIRSDARSVAGSG